MLVSWKTCVLKDVFFCLYRLLETTVFSYFLLIVPLWLGTPPFLKLTRGFIQADFPW